MLRFMQNVPHGPSYQRGGGDINKQSAACAMISSFREKKYYIYTVYIYIIYETMRSPARRADVEVSLLVLSLYISSAVAVSNGSWFAVLAWSCRASRAVKS